VLRISFVAAVVSVVAAAPVVAAPAQREIKLAAPGLKWVQLSPELATFYSDHLAQQLTHAGLRVVTANEIQTMLGIERQRQLMTCSEDQSNCMAELANALGVDALVTGSIGKFGQSYQSNLKILSSKDLSPLAAFSSRVKGDETLLDELTRAAKLMAAEVFKKMGRKPPVRAAEPPPEPRPPPVASATPAPDSGPGPTSVSQSVGEGRSPAPWIVLGAGGVALATGVVFYVQALGAAGQLSGGSNKSTLPQADAQKLYETGQRNETLGMVLGVAGIAGVTTGIVMLLTRDDEKVATPVVGVGQGGLTVGIAGSF
jgi:hypothetical protein